jgi:hypothetical protein
VTAQQEEWVPGDALYDIRYHQNSRYLFNWREEASDEHCACPDSARWPVPRLGQDLKATPDEVERFIVEVRDWWEGTNAG